MRWLKRLRLKVRHWIDPFEKFKYECSEARRRRKTLAFGIMYGSRSTPEERAEAAKYINSAVPDWYTHRRA